MPNAGGTFPPASNVTIRMSGMALPFEDGGGHST